MWFRVLAFAFAAALVTTGAAFNVRAQHKVQEAQPKKVSQRPEDKQAGDEAPASVRAGVPAKPKEDPNAAHYVYEFKQPDFFVYFIRIEHDDAGRGQIRFERRSDTEQITEPFEFSPAALARVRGHWEALAFLDSQANYQTERNYPSMGQTKLTMTKGGRERTAEFNYSQNADAQGLANEYRKASEQAILVFELEVARESQPLDTPKLIDKLDALINRDYLSDRQQLVPLIRDLTEDERIPLVGRNQAARILKKLEKQTQ